MILVVFLKHGGFKANELQCSLVGGRPGGLWVNVLALGLCRAQQKCISDGVSTGALEFTLFSYSLIHAFLSSTD